MKTPFKIPYSENNPTFETAQRRKDTLHIRPPPPVFVPHRHLRLLPPPTRLPWRPLFLLHVALCGLPHVIRCRHGRHDHHCIRRCSGGREAETRIGLEDYEWAALDSCSSAIDWDGHNRKLSSSEASSSRAKQFVLTFDL